MPKILVVEDEVAIANHLIKFLEKDNFSVEHLDSGLDVVERVKHSQPDLIILDLMLPHKDGVSCCKEIREFSDVPIIMLTAKAEEIERIIGLKAGADDYVCKPFSAVELALRIQGMLRRVKKVARENLFYLDTERFVLQYNNKEVQLTHLEFLSFNLLYQKPGRVYSREQIIELAYPHLTETNERAIDCHIKNIRKKTKDLSPNCNVIESVYGAGYRYVTPDIECVD